MAAKTTMLSFSATPINPSVPRKVLKPIGKPINEVDNRAMPTDSTPTAIKRPAMRRLLNTKMIAAINSDADAPIFKHCAFGLVEDYSKVIPALTKKLTELKK